MVARLLLVTGLFATAAVAQPTTTATAPSTSATTRRAHEELANGSLHVPVPPGWTVLARREDTLGVQITCADPPATIIVRATPQTNAIAANPEIRVKMGAAIVKDLRDKMQKEGVEVVTAPRLVNDDEFFLRVHDRHRTGGKLADRTHFYRVIGVYLMMVCAVTYDGTDPQIRQVNELAADLTWQIRPAKPPKPPGVPTTGKPSLFPKAGVRLTPPRGWVEDKADAAGGTIAVYRRPLGSAAIHVRVMDITGRNEPTDALADAVAREELTAHAIADADTTEPPRRIASPTFLWKGRAIAKRTGVEYLVETRVVAVNEKLLAVTAASGARQGKDLEPIADALAISAEKFPPRR